MHFSILLVEFLNGQAGVVLVADDAVLDVLPFGLLGPDEGVGDRRQTALDGIHHLLAVDPMHEGAPEPHVRDRGRAGVEELGLGVDHAAEAELHAAGRPLVAQAAPLFE